MIGASLALALKKQRRVDRVIGVGRSPENLDKAIEIGAIDEIVDSVATAASRADLIVIATPVDTMSDIFAQIAPHINQDKIITDVGSVKGAVVQQAIEALGENISRFVPGHPIAGKEHSGAVAASNHLYENHTVAITPVDETDAAATETIKRMWQIVGAIVVEMQVEEHDRVLSMTSHLPHLLAYAMVHYFSTSPDKERCYEMAAGGFYDFTRTASSDPIMWRDICKLNKTEMVDRISGYQQTLEELKRLVEDGQTSEIEQIFRQARESRGLVTEKRIQQQSDDGEGRRRVQQQVNR